MEKSAAKQLMCFHRISQHKTVYDIVADCSVSGYLAAACVTQKEQSKQSLIESVASISIDIIIYPSVLQTLKIVFVHFPFSIIMFLIEFTRPNCYARMF